MTSNEETKTPQLHINVYRGNVIGFATQDVMDAALLREPDHKIVLDYDSDDMIDLHERIVRSRLYFNNRDITHAETFKDAGMSPNSEEAPHNIYATIRFGGRPQIPLVKTMYGETRLEKDWSKRKHRSIKEISNDVISKFNTVLVADSVLVVFHTDPGSYRLDTKSITDETINVRRLKEGKDCNFATLEFESVDCKIVIHEPEEKTAGYIAVGLMGKFELNTYYGVFINCGDGDRSKRMSNWKYFESSKYLQLKNPYYPPGLADSSEGYSTTWRDNMGGEAVYVFRKVAEK